MSQQIPEEITESKREGGILIPFSILTDENLTNTEKHVYSYVLAFNVNGLDYFAGSENTGIKLGLNPVQVRRAVAKLCNLGYLTRAKSNGMSVLRCNKMIQLSDPIVTNRSPVCNKSLQETTQIVTHNNNINNTSNINTNTEAVSAAPQTDLNSKCENKDPLTTESTPKQKATEGASPKVPAKGVPKSSRPDPEDSSSRVLMTDAEWSKFQSQVGEECAYWWCSQLEDYAESQPKKFAAYKSHYKTLLKWHQMRCADGLVFGWTPQGGNGFYKHWVNGLNVGGKNG